LNFYVKGIKIETMFENITESTSNHNSLELMSTQELLHCINREDDSVPKAVARAIPQIEALVNALVPKIEQGGRLFYLGAGTSGRLGILDASECPPTYGVSDDVVIGLIAGGDYAIRHAVENAEDDRNQAFIDLESFKPSSQDFIIGIAASGTTPYVLGAIEMAKQRGILSGGITCNAGSPLAKTADYPIEVVVGPEFVTGSTRMKAGTAQKLVLNMISTSLMIKLGRVKGNKMVDMKLSNQKLQNRAKIMVMKQLNISETLAIQLLDEYGSVRKAIENYKVSM
jgi:N-acetylmuramic acid 6-phosphate etherase